MNATQNDTRLFDHLSEWAKLCPDECRIVRKSGSLAFFSLGFTVIEVVQKFDPIEDQKIMAIVLGAVLTAIAKKGISCQITVNGDRAFVTVNHYTCLEFGNIFSSPVNEVSIALLTAYLAYLQSKQLCIS